MARKFYASTDYLKSSSTPVTAAPLTLSAWFKPSVAALGKTLISLSDTATWQNYFRLVYDEVEGDFDAEARAVTVTASTRSGATTEGAWNHGAGVYASTTSRIAYVNATAATENTASAAPAGLDAIGIGYLVRSPGGTDTQYFDGDLAEVAIWSAALSVDEVAALADGWSPLLVRPASLECYWPLIGHTSPEIDVVGGYAATVIGATKSAHPRILYSRRHRIYVPAAAVDVPVTASQSDSVTVTDTATQAVGILVSAAEWSGEDTITSSNW